MKLYGLDIETYDPYLQDRGASWVYGEGCVIVTGLYHNGKTRVLDGNGGQTVKKLLSDPAVILAGANIQYDLGWLCHEHGIRAEDLRCGLVDTGIAEQFIDEYQQHSLDALAWKYLRERKGSGELPGIAAGMGFRGDFRKHLKALWDAGHRKEIRDYVASDADQPVRIWEKQKEIIEVQGTMDTFLLNCGLVKTVVAMKQKGVRIDTARWEKNSARLAEIYERLGRDFAEKYGNVNINSPKQMAELFRKERVPFRYRITVKGFAVKGRKFARTDCFTGDTVWERRKLLREHFAGVRVQKGKIVLYVPWQHAARTDDDIRRLGYETSCNPNIDKNLIRAMRKQFPVCAAVRELKQVKNIIDKFLGPKFARFITGGRIHADFNVAGARQTGRFSSARPNLQNIPSKTVLYEGTEHETNLAELCRELFLPEEGERLVKLDFSGQENRLQAHFATGRRGEYIRRKYCENPRLDEHDFIGTESGLYDEYGKKIGRKYAKNYRFGRGYGMQLATMMENFGWTKEQAEHITELYDTSAPWVKDTMEAVQKTVLARRYVRTLLGRRVHLREGRDRDAYKFYNYVIQGSAADMIKKAMWAVVRTRWNDTLLLTVHDEIVLSVPDTAEGRERVRELRVCMECAVNLLVPVLCEPEAGPDWYHMALVNELAEEAA